MTHYSCIASNPTPYKVKYKTTDPAANKARCREAVSSDHIYSDTPAVDGSEKTTALFFGLTSQLTNGYGLKSDSQFVGTLQEKVQKLGAMDKLIVLEHQYFREVQIIHLILVH